MYFMKVLNSYNLKRTLRNNSVGQY